MIYRPCSTSTSVEGVDWRDGWLSIGSRTKELVVELGVATWSKPVWTHCMHCVLYLCLRVRRILDMKPMDLRYVELLYRHLLTMCTFPAFLLHKSSNVFILCCPGFVFFNCAFLCLGLHFYSSCNLFAIAHRVSHAGRYGRLCALVSC